MDKMICVVSNFDVFRSIGLYTHAHVHACVYVCSKYKVLTNLLIQSLSFNHN